MVSGKIFKHMAIIYHGFNGEIWKRSLISTVIPIVKTISQLQWSFSITLFKQNLKTSSFLFVWIENGRKTKLFKNVGIKRTMWFSWPSLPQQKSKITDNCCVFNFLQRCVNGKQLMCVGSVTTVSKILPGCCVRCFKREAMTLKRTKPFHHL